MAVNPSTSFVWTGTPATGLNRSHTLVADSQFSQVVTTNTPFQSLAEDPFSVLTFRFWLGISNATWQNFFPGGWQIVSWSNITWRRYELRVIQGLGVQWWNSNNVEVTLNLPTVTTHPATRPPLSASQVIVKLNGTTLTQGSGQDYTYQLNNIGPSGAITTSNSIGKPYSIIPVWDDYTNSNLEFPGVTNPSIIIGSGTLASNFSLSAQTNRRRPGAASISASSSLIAAPGRIKLLEADLNSDFYTEAEYIDSTYFDDIYVKGFLSARLTLGGISNPQVTSNVTAQGNVIYSFSASLQSLTQVIGQAGYLQSAESSIQSLSTTDMAAGIIHSEDANIDSTFDADFAGGRIYAIESEINSDVTSTPQGNMIYDIGMQYAIDWVDPNEDYVQPYYYLGLTSQFDIYGLPMVFKQMEASVSAEFNLDAVAGFLKQIEGALASDSAINAVTGVIIASTGAATESDFSSLISGGRVYNIDEALAFDFTADFQGNRNITTTYDFLSDSTIDTVIDLFSGAQSFIFSDFELTGVGGYFLSIPLQQYYSDFNVAPVFARIITLDEYYIDLIVPETRQLFIAIEPRLIQALSETRQINIHEDPTTMIINEETRINKPEVGRSYLVGQRTRRIAA